MSKPFKIQSGNSSNNNQSIWYAESDEEARQIIDEPGTIIIINETNNFHMVMIQNSGNLNNMVQNLDTGN